MYGFIRHRRLENPQFTMQNSLTNILYPMTIYSELAPLSKYSPVMLHLFPASSNGRALQCVQDPKFFLGLLAKKLITITTAMIIFSF